MSKIDGIGGVFIQAADPKALAGWYERAFGIEFVGNEEARLYFLLFQHEDDTDPRNRVVFAIMAAQADLGPDRGEYVINYQTDDLRDLARHLAGMGVSVGEITKEDDGYNGGLFTRIRDPEGNQIELYQPL